MILLEEIITEPYAKYVGCVFKFKKNTHTQNSPKVKWLISPESEEENLRQDFNGYRKLKRVHEKGILFVVVTTS